MKRLYSMVLAIAVLAMTPNALAGGDCGPDCPGDVNGDSMVGFADILAVIGAWGPCPAQCPEDVSGNGDVDFADILAVIADWGCGFSGATTTITGFVTNVLTGDPLTGATVTVGACPFVTDGIGEYTGVLPIGQYTVSVDVPNYLPFEDDVILFPGFPTLLDVELIPVAPVVVTVIIDGDPEPGATLTATAQVQIFDGSTIEGYTWSSPDGSPVSITNTDAPSATVDLGSMTAFKAKLFENLYQPPIDLSDLPPNVPIPPGDLPSGLQDRFQVVPVNPWALEESGIVTIEVEVMTTSGTYGDDAEAHAALPWKPATGIRNVGVNLPVLLHGKDQASYNWTLQRPTGSSAVLVDGTTQTPEFTPDVPGLYRASVTDLEAGGGVDLYIFAGNFRGVIVGENPDGTPIPEATCLNCHVEGGVADDKFTPWVQTGHANAFADKLNTNSHFSENCFACHSVGFDGAMNSGLDDTADYAAFLSSGLIGNPDPGNFATMLASFPQAARRTSIQCENCHGPQDGAPGIFTAAHSQVLPRVTLAADGCGACHGEPARHGRFQQWQLSAHANYDVAIAEGMSGSCSRCHTANGFLTWLPILLGDEPGDPTASIPVTWTADEVHPQTCATCHDPHAIGTTSGSENDATVRISGTTPPLIAGFTAYGVGRGAICMTCHNSRRGLRNDAVYPGLSASAVRSAPHGSAQTDLLMGENAYFVTTGIRGNHSFIADTCANCHMSQTPPPDQLSYQLSGTNHTFYASTEICSECHGPGFTAESIQAGVQDTLDILEGAIVNAILDVFDEQIGQGYTIDLGGLAEITDVADVDDIMFGESHGQQALTVTVDGATYGPVAVGDIDVVDGMAIQGQLYDFAPDALIKSGWNWALVHNDGTLGIHNPSYAYTVLSNSITALNAGPAPAAPSWLAPLY